MSTAIFNLLWLTGLALLAMAVWVQIASGNPPPPSSVLFGCGIILINLAEAFFDKKDAE